MLTDETAAPERWVVKDGALYLRRYKDGDKSFWRFEPLRQRAHRFESQEAALEEAENHTYARLVEVVRLVPRKRASASEVDAAYARGREDGLREGRDQRCAEDSASAFKDGVRQGREDERREVVAMVAQAFDEVSLSFCVARNELALLRDRIERGEHVKAKGGG